MRPKFNDENSLFEKMDSGNQKRGVVAVGKAGDETRQQDQRSSKHADRNSANTADRGILRENSGEDLADDKELQQALEQKAGPINPPEIWRRDERRDVGSEDCKLSQGAQDRKREKSRDLA